MKEVFGSDSAVEGGETAEGQDVGEARKDGHRSEAGSRDTEDSFFGPANGDTDREQRVVEESASASQPTGWSAPSVPPLTINGPHQMEMHLAYAYFPLAKPYPCVECSGRMRFATEKELRDHYHQTHARHCTDKEVGCTYFTGPLAGRIIIRPNCRQSP